VAGHSLCPAIPLQPNTNKFYIPRQCTVKLAHAVTSIKQSLALKGHIFLVLS